MSAAVDRAVALDPGHGRVDLFGYATLERAGAGVDMEAKLKPGLSAFAQAWVGAEREQGWHKDAGVTGGLRYQW